MRRYVDPRNDFRAILSLTVARKRSISRRDVSAHKTPRAPRLNAFLEDTQVAAGDRPRYETRLAALAQLTSEQRRSRLNPAHSRRISPSAEFQRPECRKRIAHASPPTDEPDSRNFSKSLRRTRHSLPVGLRARRRPALTWRSRYRVVQRTKAAASGFVRIVEFTASTDG